MKIGLSSDFIQDKARAYGYPRVVETLKILCLGWPATSSPFRESISLLNVMKFFLGSILFNDDYMLN